MPAALGVAALLFAAGCGDDDAGSATAPTSPPPNSREGGAPSALDSANVAPTTKAEKDDPKRLGERPGDPEIPATKGDALPSATSDEKLSVVSSGDDGRWRVRATIKGGAYCLEALTPGPNDPPQQCGDTTTTGLTLATGDGTQSSVNPIRTTARGEQTKLLVWGTARRSVPKVTVRYGKQTKVAKISAASLPLAIEPNTLKALGDAADGVPSTLNVRGFAASFDLQSGNPPTFASVKARKGKGGVVLTLQ